MTPRKWSGYTAKTRDIVRAARRQGFAVERVNGEVKLVLPGKVFLIHYQKEQGPKTVRQLRDAGLDI